MGLIRQIGNRDIEITVGKGRAGPKILGLRHDKNDILASGFPYPINIELTPQFLQRRLMDADAKPTDNAKTALEKLERTPFSHPERCEIKDALLEFPPEARTRLLVRSDESADGNGLLISRNVCFEWASDLDLITAGIEIAAASVMASEYSNQVRLYKRITGNDTNTGILIMPTYGEEFIDLGSRSGASILAPPYGLDYLGPYNRRSLMTPFSTVIELDQLGMVNTDGTRTKVENQPLMKLLHALNGLPPYPRFRRSLIERIMKLIKRTGPRYLELVKDEWGSPDFVVVQSAPFSYPAIKRPDNAEWKTDVRTKFAFGVARADTHECRYMNFEIGEEPLDFTGLKDYDATHKGYLLLAEKMTAGVILNMLYEKLNIVNAGAVIIYNERPGPMAFSHLGGFFRALGIPILIIDKPPSFLEEARKKQQMELECAVYANQFERKGIVAIR